MNIEKLVRKAKEATANEMLELIDKVLSILIDKGREALSYLPSKGNVIVIGDLHGDLESLSFILKHSKFLETKDFSIFLGDYGDRGLYSPEIYFIVLSLKEDFPDRVILLRGNHEFPPGLSVYPHDLLLRFSEKYGNEGKKIYEKIREIWSYFYVGALVKGKYLFTHGGVPVELNSLDDIRFADKLYPEKSFLEEILWNDPIEDKGFYPSPRGAGKLFGKDISEKILKLIKVKTLIRSHQPPAEGIMVNHDGLILTISSTKVYGGKAAYLKLGLSEKSKNAYELMKIVYVF